MQIHDAVSNKAITSIIMLRNDAFSDLIKPKSQR